LLVKALVKESAAPGFKLKDVAEPRIREDEVLIRVRRAGVCGTDVHIYDWDAWAKGRCKPPFVVGHEFAGDVVQVGRLVTDVKEGDRVTAEGHIVDGRCLLCRTGNAHVCPFTKIIGVDRDGCFAEYISMPATNVWHLADEISYDVGGIHDPMGNAFHTVLTAEIPGAVVLITGCGPIGIFAIGICKVAGASRIIATVENGALDTIPGVAGKARTKGGAIAHAAAEVGADLGARYLVAFTETGDSARRLSRYRSAIPLLAFSPVGSTRNQLALTWGVETFLVAPVSHTDQMVRQVDRALLDLERCKLGELVVIVAGSPPGVTGSTNTLRVHRIGDTLESDTPAYS